MLPRVCEWSPAEFVEPLWVCDGISLNKKDSNRPRNRPFLLPIFLEGANGLC
nr:MAG TPA: hypothetical protein [Caudoviricetes sp.]